MYLIVLTSNYNSQAKKLHYLCNNFIKSLSILVIFGTHTPQLSITCIFHILYKNENRELA